MTRADLPPRLRSLSRVPHRLLSWGLPLGPLVLLRTRGRRTGLLRTVPVAVLRHNQQRWLVSPFGETHWVQNLRAAGRAELGRRRRYRTISVVEITDERVPEILEHYRRTFGVVPFVRRAFAAPPRDDAGSRHAATRRPVFLVQTGKTTPRAPRSTRLMQSRKS